VKAITLWPEWAWAICHLGKNVENRSWVIPPGLYTLHAGMRFDGRGIKPKHREDAILSVRGTAHYQNLTREQTDALDQIKDTLIPVGHIVGLIRVTGHTNYLRQEQWNRSMGWAAPGQIANHVELVHAMRHPVPCKGALGLWTVPDDVESKVKTP